MFKKIFLAVFLSITGFFASVHASDISPEKQKDIRKLIELAVLKNLARNSIPVELRRFELPTSKVDIVAIRESTDRIKSEAVRIMMEIMLSPSGLVNQLTPVYDKYYDHQVIKELIDFIQSQPKPPFSPETIEAIRKMVMVDPLLEEESRKISNEWTKLNTNRIRLELSRGLITMGALPITLGLAKCPRGKHDASHYASHQVDKPAKIFSRVQPAYPVHAEKSHISGSVLLQITVDEYGLVEDILVTESTHAGIFDQSAIDAFSAAMIIPACKDGFAVPSKIGVKVHYEYEPAERSLGN